MERIWKFFIVPGDRFPANQTMVYSPENEVVLQYSARIRGAGELVFPGVRIEFWDAMRFFRRDRLLPIQQRFRILPSFSAASEATPIAKRINAISRQGIHRQQRTGIGFELLELREYLDGDPPKSIAWKASARRDRLMTRQYESEVPVRVQLLIDGTAPTRIGGFGHRLIDQMMHTAASIAHSATSVGDAVGSYLFDEHEIRRMQAVSGKAGFNQQMQWMSDFSINRLPPAGALTQSLLQTALSLCSERHPELLDPQINFPSFCFHGFFSTRSSRLRTQLAAAMAELYNLSINDQVQLILSDERMAGQLTRFLSDSGMSWMVPMVSIGDANTNRHRNRIGILTRALATAISNARDNEVFIIIAELTGGDVQQKPASTNLTTPLEATVSASQKKSLEDFMNAVKIAKGKHHRVAVLCPSPTFRRPQSMLSAGPLDGVTDLLLAAEHIRLLEIAIPLKRRLAKIGVPMAFTGEPNVISMVLSEIEIARSGRLMQTGTRRGAK
jgi:Protein of unknown function DUF58